MEPQVVSPLRIAFLAGSLLCLSLSWTFGCTRARDDGAREATGRRAKADATARLAAKAGTNAHGFVRFIQDDDGVRVIAELAGMPPGPHGMHVHEEGDCSAPDFSSAGEHFATGTHRTHGMPDAAQRHTGDLGNINVEGDGTARLDREDTIIALEGDRSIIGRAVIIHELGDDGTDAKSAGGRLLCGVIERVDLGERTSHGVERRIPEPVPGVHEATQPSDNTIPPLTPPPPVFP